MSRDHCQRPCAVFFLLLLLSAIASTSRGPATGLAPRSTVSKSTNNTISLTVRPPGASQQSPTFGTSVVMAITCSKECPPWIRLDRADGVRDTSPFVRIIDEAVSFRDAPSFPMWVRPEWGPVRVGFGGAVDNQPIPFVASGWTSRWNGTQITANSSNATVFYDVGFEAANFSLLLYDIAPGTVSLSVRAESGPDAVDYDQVRLGCA